MYAENSQPMYLFILAKMADLISEVFEKSKYGILMIPFLTFIERYIFSDWEFLKFLTIAIVWDTLLGFGYALWKNEVSVKKMSGIFAKIIVYGSVLTVGHGVAHVEIKGDFIPGGEYFTMLCYAAIFIAECISILRNTGKINPNFVPKFILKRLEGFNESGDFKALVAEEKEGGDR